MKYLKPMAWQKEEVSQREQADSDLHQKLVNHFVKNYREKFNEIKNAINDDDIRVAHRLVHNLKSNAGQLKKAFLQQAAGEVERLLKDGENLVTPKQMEALEISLEAAVSELTPLLRQQPKLETAAEPPDSLAAHKLLKKLENLLKYGDPDCLSLIDDLSAIPGSEDLIQQIEQLEFELALVTLAELMRKA